MRASFTDGRILLNLASQGSAEVHGSASRFVRLQPEHTGRGQFVMSTSSARFLLNLNHVDRVPTSFDLLGISISGFLD